ncbi:MAG TPA: hypothetical protein VKB96_10895 [Gammaproteobacteria bacterium]|nr:hypothetical protein [Gammaproteobacteria bacterium]
MSHVLSVLAVIAYVCTVFAVVTLWFAFWINRTHEHPWHFPVALGGVVGIVYFAGWLWS